MEPLYEGDVVAFHIADTTYGLAHITRIDDLATANYYHFAVFDVADDVDLHPANPDESLVEHFGPMVNDEQTVVIDHVALTLAGVHDSELIKVGEREVADEDLFGYQIWLHQRGEQLMRMEILRDDMRTAREEEHDEEAHDEQEWEDVDDGSGEEGEKVEEQQEPGDEPAGEQIQVEVHMWHKVLFDRALGPALMELREDVVALHEGRGALAGYLSELYSAGSEEIGELVRRLVEEGDYSAGHELMVYGDAAAQALGEQLRDGVDPQTAEDILNILCDMGTMHGYEHIARFFAEHSASASDALAAPAVHGYCYAVTLTGGTPAPLHAELHRLDTLTDPAFADDVKLAREAVVNIPAEGAGSREQQVSSNPFGSVS